MYYLHFECSLPLSELANPKQGLITGDVNRFVRKWYECVRADLSTSSSPKMSIVQENGFHIVTVANLESGMETMMML